MVCIFNVAKQKHFITYGANKIGMIWRFSKERKLILLILNIFLVPFNIIFIVIQVLLKGNTTFTSNKFGRKENLHLV